MKLNGIEDCKLLRAPGGSGKFHAEAQENRAVCGVEAPRHVRGDGVEETVGSMVARLGKHTICKDCLRDADASH